MLGPCLGPGRAPTHGGPRPHQPRAGGRPAACCHPRCHGSPRAPALRARWRPPLPAGPSLPSLMLCRTVCSRRRPSLVALFQPRSAYISSSIHLTDRVYRLSLPLPAPKPPQHVKARAQQRKDSAARSRHAPQHSHGAAGCAAASPSQAVARGLRVPREPCRRSWPTFTHRSSWPFAFHGGRGARPSAPSALAPSPLPVPAWLLAELPFLLCRGTVASRPGSGSRAPVSQCKWQSPSPVPPWVKPPVGMGPWGGRGGPESPHPGAGRCSPAANHPRRPACRHQTCCS